MSIILFDLDGTLVDSALGLHRAVSRALDEFALPSPSLEVLRPCVNEGVRAMIGAAGLQLEGGQQTDVVNRAVELYEEHMLEAPLFHGIDQLLSHCRETNVEWGVVTNKPGRFARPLIQHHSEFNDCQVVITPDDAPAKPSGDGIRQALQTFASSGRLVFYIGDHPRDLIAARDAGVSPVAAAWGYWGDETPDQADHILDHPRDMLALLQPHVV